jgi:mycofactocin precursor peptide peptidase
MTARALSSAAWPEAGDGLLAVPVGATEQHGPHLPLTTDTEIAVALVERLAERRSEVVAAPAVAYGSSGEHAAFPGTISVGGEALELLLVELGRSASSTWKRMLLVSTHGGNADPVARAVGRLREEGRDARAWSPAARGDAHAGRVETSLMLALAPARVRIDDAVAGNLEPVEQLLPQLRRAGVRAVSPNGVLGDPEGASAAEGEVLLADAAAELERFVAAWPAA